MLKLHGYSQLCRARARIAVHLVVVGHNHFVVHKLQRRVDSSEEVLFDFALDVAAAQEVFHQSVLKRVIGDNRQSAARLEYLQRLFEQLFEHRQLVVHLDAQSLKHLCQLLFFVLRAYEWLEHVEQLLHAFDGRLVACLYNGGGNAARLLELAVEV